MAEVVTLGEPLVVFVPAGGGTLEAAEGLITGVGGAEANSARLLSRLGHEVAYISRVGDDPFGRRILRDLKSDGLSLGWVRVESGASTGFYFREVLVGGERRVYYHRRDSAASRLGPGDLDPPDFAGARLLLISGITPALSESCMDAVRLAAKMAKLAGATVAFDPNYRPTLWDRVAAREALRPIVATADIVLMNEGDAEVVMGENGERAMLAVAALGAKTVVLKSGSAGSAALVDGAIFKSSPSVSAQVVDEVGAGDAFNAGFLSAWLHGLSTAQALAIGNRLGAVAVETIGDCAPADRDRETMTADS